MAKVIVAIVLTLVAFAVSQSTTNSVDNNADIDIEAVMNACNESFRIEMAYLEALNETGSFIDETDKTPKCFIRCVLENVGILSEDDRTFNPALAATVFAGERNGKPMDDIADMTALCAVRSEKCACEKSYQFMKCLMKMQIERYDTAN